MLVLAEAGKIEALEVFSEFGNNLGLFLQLFIEMEGEVDTVVLGGNIAKTAHLFTAEVIKVMAADPRRIAKISVAFTINTPLDDKAKTILQRAALTCPVHYSLHPDIEKDITFNW